MGLLSVLPTTTCKHSPTCKTLFTKLKCLFCSYNIIFFVMTYVVPFALMGVCYTRMGLHLWGSEIVGEETPTLMKNYQNKKKVCFQNKQQHELLLLKPIAFLGCQNIFHHCVCVWNLLAAISCLLSLRLPSSVSREKILHQAHLPVLLLASHGQLHG